MLNRVRLSLFLLKIQILLYLIDRIRHRKFPPIMNESKNGLSDQKKSSLPDRLIFFLLCLIPIFSTIAYGAVHSWALGLNCIFVGLIAVFWLIDSWRGREFKFAFNALQLPIIGLIVIGLIQLLPLRRLNLPSDLLDISANNALSLAAYQTKFSIIQLVVYLVFFAAALVFINSRQRLRKMVTVIIIFGALAAFFAILQRLVSPNTIYGMEITMQAITFGSMINSHHFAAFLEMTIGLTLALFFGKATEKNKQAFLSLAAVIMGMAILLTGSRGGLLSLLGIVGFIIAANLTRQSKDAKASENNNFRRNFAFIGGGLALILLLFGAVILLGGDQSLLRGVGLQNPDDASNGRTHFWAIALKIFFDYPILGAGLDAFGTAFPQYDSWNGMYRVEQAHNEYLQTLADAGILGFVCIATFIYFLFKKALPLVGAKHDGFRRGVAVGALAGCFGILIHSFFDFPLRTPSNMFFFLLLTTLAVVSVSSSRLSPIEKSRRKLGGGSRKVLPKSPENQLASSPVSEE